MASDRRVLAALLCLSAIYLWQFAYDGWIPHDDGMLAQIAERVMAGEMPHRDFDDPYTGLLGYLHGLGFLTFGISLRSIRLVLFLFTLAWLPAMYVLARHFVPPLGAALVTALAMTWTLPNYFAAVPSYYNLFLATFGMVALARHVDTDRRYWLGIAGAFGGLAFLIKSAGGFYFVAAALLFLVCRERETVSHGTDHLPASSAPSRLRDQVSTPLLLVKLLGAALTVIVLLKLSPRPGPMELLHFVLPGTLVALVICWNETRGLPGALEHRILRLWALFWPFALGFAVPVLLFVVPYVWSGSVDDFVTGVFVLPARRFERASFGLPPLTTLWPALPYAGLLMLASRPSWLPLHRKGATLFAVVLLGLVAVSVNEPMYQLVWNSARHLGTFAVAAGCLLITSSSDQDSRKRQLSFLAVAMAAFMTLMQVPFAAPIYFAYTAPFLILAATAVVAGSGAGLLHSGVAMAYLLFAVLWMNPGYIWSLGSGYGGIQFVDAPWVKRAGITMAPHERDEYTRLVQVLASVHPTGKMLALPDCPEVYFLSGRRNPSRFIYEFLTPYKLTSQRLLRLLNARDIAVVVINTDPHFSPRLDAGLLRDLAARYPDSAQAGRFVVRWRQ